MFGPYQPLPARTARAATPICRPQPPPRVTLDTPAIEVMTDLEQVRVVTVEPGLPIDDALTRMIHAEVRMLIVIDGQGEMIGLITARDVLGERPLNHASRERVPREAVKVGHIMRAGPEIRVMALADIVAARVGDVVASLEEVGQQHGLVVQRDPAAGTERVRGIFSLVRIGAQLGIDIQADARVQSFADVEQLLNPLPRAE